MKTIQYLNFAPPEMTEVWARTQFEEIFEKAPSDSFIQATAEKESENRFRAILEIRATDMRFFVEAIGANSFECVQRLCEQANDKLTEWRAHRFDCYADAS